MWSIETSLEEADVSLVGLAMGGIVVALVVVVATEESGVRPLSFVVVDVMRVSIFWLSANHQSSVEK